MGESKFELYIYGGENIEQTRDRFDTREEAKQEAERRSSGDTPRGWEQKEESKEVLVDYNHSDKQEDLVIMRVNEV